MARARERLDDERDRSLAAEIAAGTLRWQGALDAIIGAFSRVPVARLDAEVLDVLRSAAYQLLHLERVPPSAVVNDAVELVRRERKASATGLVNAVLRRVDRERDRLPLPPAPEPDGDDTAALDYLSTTLSHPRWLVARWLARHGFEAVEAWARFDNSPAPITLRANTVKTTRKALAARLATQGIETMPTRFAPEGLVVTAGNPLQTQLSGEGLFVVQDEASQLVAAFAGAAPGERVLDACAAPGGKTLAMAGDMRDAGLLVATDLRARRLSLLARTIAAGGARVVRLARADVCRRLPFTPIFDCVLLDAPCSGLGTIRRDPEIRWRRRESDLRELTRRQREMLDRSAEVVRPGGRLVYTTCSSEPEENEEVVAEFLDRHPEFSVGHAGRAAGDGPAAAVVTGQGYVRTWPYAHGLEAFFAAILTRRAAASL
jgi:16S rRNA (cytosine967-C5)-methyltransferase